MKNFYLAELLVVTESAVDKKLSKYRNAYFNGLQKNRWVHLSTSLWRIPIILCLENMLKFLGSFEKYVRSDGGRERGTPKICENVQEEWGLPRLYVSQYFFKGVFSHLNCLCFFVFHFFNGKVKTLTP